jgi:hypothetical protein
MTKFFAVAATTVSLFIATPSAFGADFLDASSSPVFDPVTYTYDVVSGKVVQDLPSASQLSVGEGYILGDALKVTYRITKPAQGEVEIYLSPDNFHPVKIGTVHFSRKSIDDRHDEFSFNPAESSANGDPTITCHVRVKSSPAAVTYLVPEAKCKLPFVYKAYLDESGDDLRAKVASWPYKFTANTEMAFSDLQSALILRESSNPQVAQLFFANSQTVLNETLNTEVSAEFVNINRPFFLPRNIPDNSTFIRSPQDSAVNDLAAQPIIFKDGRVRFYVPVQGHKELQKWTLQLPEPLRSALANADVYLRNQVADIILYANLNGADVNYSYWGDTFSFSIVSKDQSNDYEVSVKVDPAFYQACGSRDIDDCLVDSSLKPELVVTYEKFEKGSLGALYKVGHPSDTVNPSSYGESGTTSPVNRFGFRMQMDKTYEYLVSMPIVSQPQMTTFKRVLSSGQTDAGVADASCDLPDLAAARASALKTHPFRMTKSTPIAYFGDTGDYNLKSYDHFQSVERFYKTIDEATRQSDSSDFVELELDYSIQFPEKANQVLKLSNCQWRKTDTSLFRSLFIRQRLSL